MPATVGFRPCVLSLVLLRLWHDRLLVIFRIIVDESVFSGFESSFILRADHSLVGLLRVSESGAADLRLVSIETLESLVHREVTSLAEHSRAHLFVITDRSAHDTAPSVHRLLLYRIRCQLSQPETLGLQIILIVQCIHQKPERVRVLLQLTNDLLRRFIFILKGQVGER